MMKKLISLAIIGLFTGCSIFTPMTEEEKKAYQIMLERKSFEDHHLASQQFKIDAATKKFSTMLLDAHTPFIYAIALPQYKEVGAVELVIDKGWNVDNLLVPKKDFFWDSVNKELLLPLTIPYIYMLDNEISLKAKIHGVIDRSLVINEKEILFYHKPLEDNDETYLSFSYLNSLKNEKIDPFIKAQVKSEFEKLNKTRVSKAIIKRLEDLIELY